MNRILTEKKILIPVICIIVLLGIITFRIILKNVSEKTDQQESGFSQANVIQADRQNIMQIAKATGEIRALSTVEITPEISGKLINLRRSRGDMIEPGKRVRRNEQIAVIEHNDLRAAVNGAKAQLQVATASLEAAEIACKDALREKERIANLFKAGSSTEQQQDKAIIAYENALAKEKLAKAQVVQAEAGLEQAKTQLNKAFIRAPVAGIIAKKYIDEGNMVSGAMPLLKIVNIDTVKLIASVNERYMPFLKPGATKVKINIDALKNKPFEGTLYNIEPVVDSQTRTVVIETRIPNPGHKLKPGMFACLTVNLETKENVITLPQETLIEKYGHYYVYLVENNRIKQVRVKTGISYGGNYEILQGVDKGDIVVVSGQQNLKPGKRVQLQFVDKELYNESN
jgi:RND family efflux transporter MFP subunit